MERTRTVFVFGAIVYLYMSRCACAVLCVIGQFLSRSMSFQAHDEHRSVSLCINNRLTRVYFLLICLGVGAWPLMWFSLIVALLLIGDSHCSAFFSFILNFAAWYSICNIMSFVLPAFLPIQIPKQGHSSLRKWICEKFFSWKENENGLNEFAPSGSSTHGFSRTVFCCCLLCKSVDSPKLFSAIKSRCFQVLHFQRIHFSVHHLFLQACYRL